METYIHKVRYYECDRMGITHHSNYIRYMEEARIDFLEQLGYGFEKIEADGVTSPVVSISCEYKKPTTFQDEIDIDVKVIGLTTLKLKFGYTMTCHGTVVFTAESTHCFLENGKPVSIGERYPGLANALQSLMASYP